jgi:hypothetical protein
LSCFIMMIECFLKSLTYECLHIQHQTFFSQIDSKNGLACLSQSSQLTKILLILY